MKKTKVVFLLLVLLAYLAFAQTESQATKAVVVKMNIKNGQITVLDSQVVYGSAPARPVEWHDFRINSVSGNSTTLDRFGIEDPRVFRLLDFNEGEPTRIVKDDVNFTVVLAFRPGIAEMRVSNYTTNATIASINLTGAVNSFCSSHSADPDCQKPAPQTEPIQKPGGNCLPFTLLSGLLAAVLLTAFHARF
ncbi:hypothetical protein H0O00_01775 [Candidatus Micrarchaeota archaeon]|nr:hypothetical protein [Candidatus Micrarchaeota archaeon]